MKCPNCQSENRETAKYCDECGFPLSGRIAQMAALDGDDSDKPIEAKRAASLAADSRPEDSTGTDVPTAEAESDERAEAQAAEEAPAPETSAPIDLPRIAVPGVNVDDDGNEFDFGPLEGEARPAEDGQAAGPADEGRPSTAPSSAGASDKTSELPLAGETARIAPSVSAAPDITVDLSGVETLVDGTYVPPSPAWQSGGTMEMPAIKGADAPAARDFRAPDPNAKGGGKGKVVAIVIALLLGAAALAAGVTYSMELWGGKMVPDTTGKSEADARYLLESKGFAVRTTQVKSDDVEGIVLLMDPSAGSRVEEGEEVVIHLSVSRAVPDVLGKTQDEARELMNAEGFERVDFVPVKSNEPEGTVLSVSPEAGTKAKAVTAITVEVAQAYTVPDVTGSGRADAVAALEAEGYAVDVRWTYNDAVPEGTAVSTEPAAGAKHPSGETVTLYLALSRGNELVGLTKEFLQPGGVYVIGGSTYKVKSVDAVSYEGNDTVSYTISAVEVGYLFGVAVENPAGSQALSGTIAWTADNVISSSSPAIEKA